MYLYATYVAVVRETCIFLFLQIYCISDNLQTDNLQTDTLILESVLSERKARKLLRLMKAYRHLMKIYDVCSYRACATSAMRDAKNSSEIIKEISKETGINIEIIGGSEEARIIYSNHLECMADRHGTYLYVDVGGGSTEINFLKEGELLSSVSYNIGTVRLLTGKVRDDEWIRMQHDLEKLSTQAKQINIIGSGGNINKIYRMASVKNVLKQSMPVSSVREVYNQLNTLSVEERMNLYALKPDRADVIVPAAEIFLRIAELVHANHILVPIIGLTDGIIDELYTMSLNNK